MAYMVLVLGRLTVVTPCDRWQERVGGLWIWGMVALLLWCIDISSTIKKSSRWLSNSLLHKNNKILIDPCLFVSTHKIVCLSRWCDYEVTTTQNGQSLISPLQVVCFNLRYSRDLSRVVGKVYVRVFALMKSTPKVSLLVYVVPHDRLAINQPTKGERI